MTDFWTYFDVMRKCMALPHNNLPTTHQRFLSYCKDNNKTKGDAIYQVSQLIIWAMDCNLVELDAPNDRVIVLYSHEELQMMVYMERL